MYVSRNKHFVSFQNCFGPISWLCQEKGWKTFPHFMCLRGQNNIQLWVAHPCCSTRLYMGADKSLARPGRKQGNVSVRMAWISFGALPCRKRNLMTARVSMLLKSRVAWHASGLFFFLVGISIYQHPGIKVCQPLYLVRIRIIYTCLQHRNINLGAVSDYVWLTLRSCRHGRRREKDIALDV